MRLLLRAGEIANRLLSYAPVALLLVIGVLAAWMRFLLGRWPITYRDDPGGIVATFLDLAAIWLFMASWFGLPIWALTLAPTWTLRGRDATIQRALVYGGAFALFFVMAWWDPLGFMDWWMD